MEFVSKKKKFYFCIHITGLTHGVMVALQILVLPVKVRILMGQQRKTAYKAVFFMPDSKKIKRSSYFKIPFTQFLLIRAEWPYVFRQH